MSLPPNFSEYKSLKDLCTLGIGGPARYFAEIRTIAQMEEIIKISHVIQLPFIVIGKGSNCLFSDQGFNGIVIQNKIDFLDNPSNGIFHVGAGYSFSLLGVQTARQGWAGLEFASGIPASVGGAVYMNAGANGQETCDTLVQVDYIDEFGNQKSFQKEQLHFAYRTSSFQKMRGAIVGATFKLTPCNQARKKQIEIISYRKKTQPLSDKSAGCIFRNPSCGHAGALIEKSGLKGMAIGGAKVSEKHANFLVNVGEASSADILKLIELVQHRVKETAGVHLESEVKVIPFEPSNAFEQT